MLATSALSMRFGKPCTRTVSYRAGYLSRVSAAVAGGIVNVLSGSQNSPLPAPGRAASPRAQTAIAQAARDAGAQRAGLQCRDGLPPHLCAAIKPDAGRSAKLDAPARIAAAAGPGSLYRHLVAAGSLKHDASQGASLARFDRLFQGLRCPAPDTRGIYLHGQVGTGKTRLMDLFVASVTVALPELRLLRVHLHDFLRMVHDDLHALRSSDDVSAGAGDAGSQKLSRDDADVASTASLSPFSVQASSRWWLLGEEDDRGRRRTGMAAGWVHASRSGAVATSVEKVALSLAARLDVLCFDEVAITTIQDCAVLAPLLRTLCGNGVVVVATSNRMPASLYAGGLNRHVYLPALVEAIHGTCDVHHLESTTDHRVRLGHADSESASGHRVFHWGCSLGSHHGSAILDTWWAHETGTHPSAAATASVPLGYGRSMRALQSPCQQFGRFTFGQLCSDPLGPQDFAALCGRFRALVVADVPRLRAGAHSEAQRWIWLLDQCYERHTRLVLTSVADGPEDLVDLRSVAHAGAGGGRSLREVSFAVARATSRLHEMQTRAFQVECAKQWTPAASAA